MICAYIKYMLHQPIFAIAQMDLTRKKLFFETKKD